MPTKQYIIRRIAAIVLALLAVVSTARAGEGELYIDAYNTLVGMLRDRCEAVSVSTNGLDYKDIADTNKNTVVQSDLNALRPKVITLLDSHYIVHPDDFVVTNGDSAAAFPYGRVMNGGELSLPSLMEDIGNNGSFTKVPGRYVSDGQGIYTNTFTDVPILWVHFDELNKTILRMRYTKKGGNWTAKGEGNSKWTGWRAGWPGSWGAAKGHALLEWEDFGDPRTSSTVPRNWTEGYKTQSYWRRAQIYMRYAYYRITGLASIEHEAGFYYYASKKSAAYSQWDTYGDDIEESTWTCWDTVSAGTATSNTSTKLGPSQVATAPVTSVDDSDWCQDPGEASSSRGYAVNSVQAIIEWRFVDGYVANPLLDDPGADGLVATGCDCIDCLPGANVDWRNMLACAHVKFPLGMSSGLTTGGLRVKAYISEYKISGVNKQMFSLDTAVISSSTNATEGWEFAAIKRPSGAEVVFGMEGSSAGAPVNLKRSYRLNKVGSKYELSFGCPSGKGG